MRVQKKKKIIYKKKEKSHDSVLTKALVNILGYGHCNAGLQGEKCDLEACPTIVMKKVELY